MSAKPEPAVPTPEHQRAIELNEALVLTSVRQQELTDAADKLNVELRATMAERALATDSLRQNEALFASIIDYAPGGVYVVDGALRMLQVNARARPVFAQVDSLLGRDFGEVMAILWGAEVGGEVTARFRHTLASGEHYVSPHFDHPRHDIAVEQAYDWEIQRVTLPGGGWGVVCYFTDITERLRADDALREKAAELARAARAKDEFLAMLAHELRNPLSSVANAVTLLKEANTAAVADRDAGDAAEQKRAGDDDEIRTWATDVIDRQSRQLARLVEDLLDASRIMQGKVALRRARIDAAGALASAGETVAPLVAARGHTLLNEFPRGELWLDADATRLEQIVVNLLTNAAKYTEPGGRIVLRARREAEEIVITVRDNGTGIPPERIPEMFELFTQGERSIARSEGGLGIGLTVVRGLCELHGGSVSAQSDGPGAGSLFTVRLPAAPPPTSATNGAQLRLATPGEGAGARILVVDDNVDTAAGLARLLVRRGYTVALAHDGPAALERAREFAPAAVLLDIGLPGMDGYEVAARLRTGGCCADALIVALTGYGQDEDRARSRAAGFDHHLVKPVDFEELRALLASRLCAP